MENLKNSAVLELDSYHSCINTDIVALAPSMNRSYHVYQVARLIC